MTVKEMAEKLNLMQFTPDLGLEREITGGYTSDLLSDVMGYADEGQVWITLQVHKNVTGIASLKDLAAIVIVKGFSPDRETIDTAQQEGIPILGTDMQAFEFSGRLYELLK